MKRRLFIINGPNINLIGRRIPTIYGDKSWRDIETDLSKICTDNDIELAFFQSNHEGQLIDKIHQIYAMDVENEDSNTAIIINAGAFSHTSYAIRDAIEAVQIPTVEVHFSNVHAREDFRQNSVIAPVCIGQITGFKDASYMLAVNYFIKYWE